MDSGQGKPAGVPETKFIAVQFTSNFEHLADSFMPWPRNLAGKLLNEAGKPPRECIVVRAQGEGDIGNARAVLVETLLVGY